MERRPAEETGRREGRARVEEDEEEDVVLRRERVVGAAAEAIISGLLRCFRE